MGSNKVYRKIPVRNSDSKYTDKPSRNNRTTTQQKHPLFTKKCLAILICIIAIVLYSIPVDKNFWADCLSSILENSFHGAMIRQLFNYTAPNLNETNNDSIGLEDEVTNDDGIS